MRIPLIKSYDGLRQLLVYSLAACLFSLVLVFWLTTPMNSDWEVRFQTNYYLMRSIFGEPKVSALPLVVILIDDASLPAGSPRSPIDRRWLTHKLQKIDQQNPELIILNILLDRPSTAAVDRDLVKVIKEAGNVILRDDPIYPVLPSFAEVALDRGSIQFRLDSAGNLQETCNNPSTCQTRRILHHQIWKQFPPAFKLKGTSAQPSSAWLKINFSSATGKTSKSQIAAHPIIRIQDLDNLSQNALKGKLVLIGTGFSDIYPLFQIPLGSPPIELQETEILGELLQMMASDTYLISIHKAWIGLLAFGLMIILAILMMVRGPILTLVFGLLFGLLYFLISSVGFAFFNLEIPFIGPVIIIFIFILGGILVQSLQDRFDRLNLELDLKEKQVDFLTNELHTHHLFNEFSRIGVMMKQRPEAAREYLIEFAEMLRLSLKYGDQRQVPVAVQMEFIKLYINQQEIIHQGQLTFELTFDADVQKESTAPWHTFFPLVENAVKYASAYQKSNPDSQALVQIQLTVSGQQLEFKTENSYDQSPVASSNTGIENLRKRLTLAYPQGNFELSSSSSDQKWVTRLIIPIS